jgi:hypothetical protein
MQECGNSERSILPKQVYRMCERIPLLPSSLDTIGHAVVPVVDVTGEGTSARKLRPEDDQLRENRAIYASAGGGAAYPRN